MTAIILSLGYDTGSPADRHTFAAKLETDHHQAHHVHADLNV